MAAIRSHCLAGARVSAENSTAGGARRWGYTECRAAAGFEVLTQKHPLVHHLDGIAVPPLPSCGPCVAMLALPSKPLQPPPPPSTCACASFSCTGRNSHGGGGSTECAGAVKGETAKKWEDLDEGAAHVLGLGWGKCTKCFKAGAVSWNGSTRNPLRAVRPSFIPTNPIFDGSGDR
eukprot:1269872-Prymnesium_polylepis.1